MDYLLYLLTAFFLSFFLGMWRVNTKKFSVAWFGAIHLPIPLIIWMRINFKLSLFVIPVGIALAVFGQVLGSRIYQNYKNKSAV